VPASFCGVFGLKPHMGRVPNVPFPRGWESLAHHGPLARTVADAALLLDIVSAPHPADRWALPPPSGRFADACTGSVEGLKLAWCARLGSLPVEREVLALCDQGASRFEHLGCRVEEIELDLPDLGRAQQTIVICEAAAGFADRRAEWEQVIYPGIRRMLSKSDKYTYHDLVRAHWERDAYWERLAPVMERYDALLTPVASVSATRNGTLGPDRIEGRPARALAWLSFCVPFNMTWQPAASLPVGRDALGIPVGLQLVGRRFDEATLLRLASAYEQAYPWTQERPPATK
jgi:aspartyl-tRNA(Asn)/glutamyl-tRNA(Gln) amidotransferase subunit A